MIPQLTFDDGPSEWTPAILDLLYDRDVHAAFFWVGQHILEHPELVDRALAEGHIVGGHTWSHRRLSDLGTREAGQEIWAPCQLIEIISGEWPRYWRAPFFDQGPWASIAEAAGLEHVGADIVPDDWMASDPEAVAAAVLSELAPGKVVCLHDGVPPAGGSTHCTASRDVTVAALELILAGMPVAG